MNKIIKKIIAVALTVSAFCTIAPTTNLMTTKAYAATSDSQLKSIYLSDGTIDFSSSTYSYKVKVGRSVDEIRITAKPKNTHSTVEIDGTTVDENEKYRKTVYLDKGENTIKIKVTDEDDNRTRTYTLKVNRGTSSSHDDNYDDVYLKSLSLSDGDINFNEERTSYDVNVNSSVDKIKITAKPDYSDYKVRIDGTEVDENENYRKTIYLDKGKNKIKVEVKDKDNDKYRTYTLNIIRGTSTDNNIYLDSLKVEGTTVNLSDNKTSYDLGFKESIDQVTIKAVPKERDYDVKINGSTVDKYDDYEKTVSLNKGGNKIEVKIQDQYNDKERVYTLNITRGTITTETNATIKANQWVYVNGQMQYNDALGNTLKNTWFWDKDALKYYYLDYNGNRATGWLYNNLHWYLLDAGGAMQKGWQYINGAWYYLDESGQMKTGWFKDFNGTWYYLNSNGSMAYNTKINGYKLGANGAWLSR